MITIDIETISGVPLTGDVEHRAAEDVGADQEAEQEYDRSRGQQQRARVIQLHSVSSQATGQHAADGMRAAGITGRRAPIST